MKQQYQTLINSIIDTSKRYERKDPVKLLAVSKIQPAAKIRALFALGQKDFGENYYQEALEKITELADLAITWHFIGAIQSNKAKAISQQFDWVQTVDRTKIAQILHQHRPDSAKKLNVLVQVNVNDEQSKAGVHIDEVDSLCQEVLKLPRLRLRGLMAIPKASDNPQMQRNNFLTMKNLYDKLSSTYQFDTLSMGMSGDYPEAIANGSTMVRIGRQLFGERETR